MDRETIKRVMGIVQVHKRAVKQMIADEKFHYIMSELDSMSAEIKNLERMALGGKFERPNGHLDEAHEVDTF